MPDDGVREIAAAAQAAFQLAWRRGLELRLYEHGRGLGVVDLCLALVDVIAIDTRFCCFVLSFLLLCLCSTDHAIVTSDSTRVVSTNVPYRERLLTPLVDFGALHTAAYEAVRWGQQQQSRAAIVLLCRRMPVFLHCQEAVGRAVL